jgi:RNA polymerase sigma-70 factor (ECF subfamily)
MALPLQHASNATVASVSPEAAYFSDALVAATEPNDAAQGSTVNEPDARAEEQTAGTVAETRNPSDEILLTLTCQGDREALGLLFRRYATIVRVVGERILHDAAEAEDLVQEVFLFVFRKASLFDSTRGSARSWLVQVTYHRAFDRRRYLASRRFYSNLELQEAILEAEEPAALPYSYENTLEAALGEDALCRIDKALSEVQREVLRLHFFEGYTAQEIASLIGQSVGNVRNHYYRALEKMRRELFSAPLQGK